MVREKERKMSESGRGSKRWENMKWVERGKEADYEREKVLNKERERKKEAKK